MSYPGSRIRWARERKNYSQDALGAVIGKSGSTVSRIESGQIDISLSELKLICEDLEISANWVLWGTQAYSENIEREISNAVFAVMRKHGALKE